MEIKIKVSLPSVYLDVEFLRSLISESRDKMWGYTKAKDY